MGDLASQQFPITLTETMGGNFDGAFRHAQPSGNLLVGGFSGLTPYGGPERVKEDAFLAGILGSESFHHVLQQTHRPPLLIRAVGSSIAYLLQRISLFGLLVVPGER